MMSAKILKQFADLTLSFDFFFGSNVFITKIICWLLAVFIAQVRSSGKVFRILLRFGRKNFLCLVNIRLAVSSTVNIASSSTIGCCEPQVDRKSFDNSSYCKDTNETQ